MAEAKGGSATRRRLLIGTALFVLGFSAVFVVTTLVSATAGFWLMRWQDLITRILGVVLIVMGLVFTGRLGFLQREVKASWRPATGLAGAPLLGVVFGIGWAPCIGPTLAVVISMSLTSADAGRGVLLGVAYCIGLGVPFLLVALGLGWMTRTVGFLRRHIRTVNLVGGAVLVLIGLLMVSGLWSAWMLQLQGVIAQYVPAI
ncbi:Cytochrome C biogenesis protein transmembrane region [Clavibacter michiganensis]|nr:Cytochrome C biogenesis protein transmembrane region [Clavibacter michiganensis]